MLKLDTELAQIKGINRRLLNALDKLKIKTAKDLLWHFPFRYDDFSQVMKIAEVLPEQTVTICGQIKKVDARRTWKKRMILVEAIIADDSGGIKAVWFNQPYLIRNLPVGKVGNFAGKIVTAKNDIYLSNPVFEPLGYEAKHTAGLIPIYPETKGITSKGLRYLIRPILKNLERLPEFIPAAILNQTRLPEINIALQYIHSPAKLEQAELAKGRFAFEDLFLLQLNNLKLKLQLAQSAAIPIKIAEEDVRQLKETLPFTLTTSQEQALKEILDDLQKPQPMNRLLQGDVGSGKTVVVAMAALLTAKSGFQGTFMAPTEVLANQHYKTLTKIFGPLLKKWRLCLTLLTGSHKETVGDIVVGTHALIQKTVKFEKLALVVVDEQHRFGVEQRATLVKSTSDNLIPHFLSMSATPIPRTLTLTIFGDLDLSIINELPAGRRPIITKIVAPANRIKAYKFIRERIKEGRQCFVICPRIEATENHTGTLWDDVKAVEVEYEKLSKQIFPDLKVAMLHGRLKADEKNRLMTDFSQNKTDILVATSVIEVGVDVPNATIMMIEGSDRFGLAQLYQLRGRVGRAEHQSFCFLFTDSTSATTHRRLKSLLEAKNGFELAEMDLAIRGPGEFLGQSQTGMPDLAMKALNNMELVKTARLSAAGILKEDSELKKYPLLETRLEQFRKQVHLE